MAHIIRDEEQFRLSVFVILFPEANSFFVWKASEGKLRQAYKYHYYCESAKTKKHFLDAKERGEIPPMYCLETIEATQEEAFFHCVAWAKYFMEQGLQSCCGVFLDRYTVDLRDESRKIFAAIQQKELNSVCPPGEDLFPSFGRQNTKREPGKNTVISFRLPTEEYNQIKSDAETTSLTVTEYCKKMIYNGHVIQVHPEVFATLSNYVNEFVVRDNLLKSILAAIYSTRTYFPADLAIVQEAISDNARQQAEAIQEVKELLKQLLEQGKQQ